MNDDCEHQWIDHLTNRSGAQEPLRRICLDCGKEDPYRYCKTLREANERRQKEWDPNNKLPLSFRFCELAGEVGEVCNVLKKLEREQLGIPGSRATSFMLMEELADVAICVDILLMTKKLPPSTILLTNESETDELYKELAPFTHLGKRMAYWCGRMCDSQWDNEYGLDGDFFCRMSTNLLATANMAARKVHGHLEIAIESKFNATSAKVGLLTRMGEQP